MKNTLHNSSQGEHITNLKGITKTYVKLFEESITYLVSITNSLKKCVWKNAL